MATLSRQHVMALVALAVIALALASVAQAKVGGSQPADTQAEAEPSALPSDVDSARTDYPPVDPIAAVGGTSANAIVPPDITVMQIPVPVPVGVGKPPQGSSAPGVVTGDGVTKVIGDGTPGSCTSGAVARAMVSGGSITFDCGPNPLTITLTETLHTCNTDTCAHPWKGGTKVNAMTLDGGGLITLNGAGRGIFYSNTCEESYGWLSSSCQKETTPHITFRNLGFTGGDATSGPPGVASVGGGGGGGAIAMRGGQLTVENSWFANNRCVTAHSDAGGGAIRVVGMVQPVTITDSTFKNNKCANGGAISSLQATLVITNCEISGNTATGSGASSGNGGNGGGVYYDGNSNTVTIRDTMITGNHAPEGGPALFYVSNNLTGTVTISGSTFSGNSGQSFYTSPYRSIFYKGNGSMNISSSTIQ